MPIRDWLENKIGEVLESSDGRELRVNCPFCTRADTKHHLYLSTDRQVCHCFRCEWSGSHVRLVMEVEGITSYAEALRILAGPTSSIDQFESIADRLAHIKRKVRPDKELSKMPQWYVPFSKPGKEGNPVRQAVLRYALNRLLPEEILEHNIGWCNDPTQGLLWHRMIIPVEDGYYQARDIGNSENKYLNPEFPAGGRIFNHKVLKRANPLIVCEGCISAIAAGDNAVAVMGKSATTQQATRLSKAVASAVVVAFDHDATFSVGALRLADHLVACGKKVLIRSYEDGDPDSCNVFEDAPYNTRLKVAAMLGAV